MFNRVLISLSLAAIPLWIWVAEPQITKLRPNFSYISDIVSLDNFYDEATQRFSGESRTIAKFSFDVTDEKNGVLAVKNIFDVQELTGKKIIAIERSYGIDAVTRKHVPGHGDRDRDGYLFAPRGLKEGQPFTYWHINYDGPARMKFVGKEMISGLQVYRYETRYEGVAVDQTKNLGYLPDVGVTRGVELEPHLQLWIEPVSGYMVKYKDDTVAYFYDLETGRRLHPWNRFTNTFTLESVEDHIAQARREMVRIVALETWIPALFILLAAVFLIFSLKNKKIRLYLSLASLVGVMLFLGWLLLWSEQKVPQSLPGPIKTVRLGVEKGPLSSLVWVAEHNGYFREQGINLELQEFPSGRAALTHLLATGDIDVATVAQTPVILNSFLRNDFQIFAAMVSSQNDVKILIRKDTGIANPSDLRGKKIGITKNSTGHYFLGLFLAQHGLGLGDVRAVEFEASDLSRALSDGAVDAISTWEPHIYNAKSLMGNNAETLESKGTFREDFYFAVFRDWAKNNGELLKRFLLAIDKAQEFVKEQPKESQRIVAERLQLDPLFVESVWGDYSFQLFLDQAVLLTFEQQARWFVANNLTLKTIAPNYLDFIYFDALEAVKPEAVTIVR